MALRRDDEDAFALFCMQLHPRLVGSLTLYVGQASDAEDLAQEALARTWRDWGRLRTVEGASAFVFRVAINLAKNQFRRAAVRRRYAHLVAAEDRHADPDGADAVAVREALLALSDRRRAALVLRFYGGLGVAETAAAMDVPPNTVKTLTRRGLQQLRQQFDEVPDEEVPHAR